MAPLSDLRVNLWQASQSGLPETEVTLAEVTRQAGYRNALIGKCYSVMVTIIVFKSASSFTKRTSLTMCTEMLMCHIYDIKFMSKML